MRVKETEENAALCFAEYNYKLYSNCDQMNQLKPDLGVTGPFTSLHFLPFFLDKILYWLKCISTSFVAGLGLRVLLYSITNAVWHQCLVNWNECTCLQLSLKPMEGFASASSHLRHRTSTLSWQSILSKTGFPWCLAEEDPKDVIHPNMPPKASASPAQ